MKQQNCEIRSGLNGVFDCERMAIGTWNFTHSRGLDAPLRVCRLHARRFTRQGFWKVNDAFKGLGLEVRG